jgi:hypothetical protein
MARIVLCLSVFFLLVTGLARGAVFPHVNPADRLAGRAIDSYEYDYAKRCVKTPQTGAVALQHWLEAHVAGEFWGIMRCEKWGPKSASLHAEGRAIDWHLDARDPAAKAQAYRLIKLLLASDKHGNGQALARRMGIQEIIYDCKSWWSNPSDELGHYSYCYSKKTGKRKQKIDATAAHIDHLHLGLSRRGAARKTSFWLSAGQAKRLPLADRPAQEQGDGWAPHDHSSKKDPTVLTPLVAGGTPAPAPSETSGGLRSP